MKSFVINFSLRLALASFCETKAVRTKVGEPTMERHDWEQLEVLCIKDQCSNPGL